MAADGRYNDVLFATFVILMTVFEVGMIYAVKVSTGSFTN